MKTIWRTYDGRRMTFDQMEDKHLANIFQLITNRNVQHPEDLIAEIKKRKLSKAFLSKAPYMFVEQETGKTKIWNYSKGKPVECYPELKVIKTKKYKK